MKKLLSKVLAFTCATACVISLTACGGGDGQSTNPDLLTEAEWKQQLNAAIDNPDYNFRQSHYDEGINGYVQDTALHIDATTRGYYYFYIENNAMSESYLFIKDGVYYEANSYSDSGTFSARTKTITAEKFDDIEDVDYLSSWHSIVSQALTLCRDNFGDFKTDAGTIYETTDVDATILNPFTETNMNVSIGRITFIFQDKKISNIGLYEIEGDGIDSAISWEYNPGANMENVLTSVYLPAMKGASFELTSINGNSGAPDVLANEGKYVEWKEDGTLDGDLTIEGQDISGSTIACGDDGIVVTFGDYTLTGYSEYINSQNILSSVLELTLSVGGSDYTYTFTKIA